jgi:hypothetical protein
MKVGAGRDTDNSFLTIIAAVDIVAPSGCAHGGLEKSGGSRHFSTQSTGRAHRRDKGPL